MSLDVTGNWQGVFSYPDSLMPINFEAQLREKDGFFSGLVHETDDDGRGLMRFTAIIEGARQGREVDFRKTYDDFDPICIVDYAGKLDRKGVQISGEWVRLDDMISGSFVMQRRDEAEQTIERELEVAAPLNRQAP